MYGRSLCIPHAATLNERCAYSQQLSGVGFATPSISHRVATVDTTRGNSCLPARSGHALLSPGGRLLSRVNATMGAFVAAELWPALGPNQRCPRQPTGSQWCVACRLLKATRDALELASKEPRSARTCDRGLHAARVHRSWGSLRSLAPCFRCDGSRWCRPTNPSVATCGSMPSSWNCTSPSHGGDRLPAERTRVGDVQPRRHAISVERVFAGQLAHLITVLKFAEADGAVCLCEGVTATRIVCMCRQIFQHALRQALVVVLPAAALPLCLHPSSFPHLKLLSGLSQA